MSSKDWKKCFWFRKKLSIMILKKGYILSGRGQGQFGKSLHLDFFFLDCFPKMLVKCWQMGNSRQDWKWGKISFLIKKYGFSHNFSLEKKSKEKIHTLSNKNTKKVFLYYFKIVYKKNFFFFVCLGRLQSVRDILTPNMFQGHV